MVGCDNRQNNGGSLDAVDFNRQHLHVVQVGLGTCATIFHNLAGAEREWDSMLGWLLESTSEDRPNEIRAVAVEPVAEHVRRLRKRFSGDFPRIALVHSALDEFPDSKDEIYVFTKEAYLAAVESVPLHQKEDVERQLVYLRNMSCVGGIHPDFKKMRRKIRDRLGVDVAMEAERTDVCTYHQLVEQFNFKGVELLLIDAEGYDTRILRSVAKYCQTQESNGSWEWPQVICCETMGHCDKIDGEGSEDACLQMLQHDFGYNVLMAGGSNTVLVKGSVLDQHLRLQRWIAKHMYCHYCGSTWWPFSLIKGGKLHCLSAACISEGMTC